MSNFCKAKRKWEEATKCLAIGGQATMDVARPGLEPNGKGSPPNCCLVFVFF